MKNFILPLALLIITISACKKPPIVEEPEKFYGDLINIPFTSSLLTSTSADHLFFYSDLVNHNQYRINTENFKVDSIGNIDNGGVFSQIEKLDNKTYLYYPSILIPASSDLMELNYYLVNEEKVKIKSFKISQEIKEKYTSAEVDIIDTLTAYLVFKSRDLFYTEDGGENWELRNELIKLRPNSTEEKATFIINTDFKDKNTGIVEYTIYQDNDLFTHDIDLTYDGAKSFISPKIQFDTVKSNISDPNHYFTGFFDNTYGYNVYFNKPKAANDEGRPALLISRDEWATYQSFTKQELNTANPDSATYPFPIILDAVKKSETEMAFLVFEQFFVPEGKQGYFRRNAAIYIFDLVKLKVTKRVPVADITHFHFSTQIYLRNGLHKWNNTYVVHIFNEFYKVNIN
jgi:hypothetical protein